MENKVKKTVNNRIDYVTYKKIVWAFGILSILGLLVIGSLVKYQLVDHEKYKALVLSQLTTETSVNPERGVITDRNGVVLAANKSVYNVIISPHHINAKNEQIKALNSGIMATYLRILLRKSLFGIDSTRIAP